MSFDICVDDGSGSCSSGASGAIAQTCDAATITSGAELSNIEMERHTFIDDLVTYTFPILEVDVADCGTQSIQFYESDGTTLATALTPGHDTSDNPTVTI